MKSSDQTQSAAKGQNTVSKAKGGKSMPPKIAKRARKSAHAAKKSPSQARPAFAGYSDSAARLIARGKNAFGDAYAWAGEARSKLPKAARDLNLPDSNSLKTAIEDKPLILGAAGLGLGVIIGAMLPSAFSAGTGKRPASRPSRRK